MGRGGEGFPRRVPDFSGALVGKVASPAYHIVAGNDGETEGGHPESIVVRKTRKGTPIGLDIMFYTYQTSYFLC